ncbi:MAG: hypothetical protein IPH31_09985 [Lewinellaceae bacterium]|nr:hypothetical protein [Lewinellaceae bacterium]
MPYNSNERLEREARESLVASDLSAKMKQWREQSPPPAGGGGGISPLRILLVLLLLGGAAWLFWPQKEQKTPPLQEQPAELPAPPQSPVPEDIKPVEEPIAQKPSTVSNRYLALAQSNYRSPDFASDIRGEASEGQNALNDARLALAERRFSDALIALKNTPSEYNTDAAYLRGHALFGQKKFPQSAVVFGQLTGSIRYGEAAQWYELLSLLPEFEENKSVILKKLKRISEDEDHAFYQEARDLYQSL